MGETKQTFQNERDSVHDEFSKMHVLSFVEAVSTARHGTQILINASVMSPLHGQTADSHGQTMDHLVRSTYRTYWWLLVVGLGHSLDTVSYRGKRRTAIAVGLANLVFRSARNFAKHSA